MLPVSLYPKASVTDLLTEAALARVGIDKRWLKAILDRGPAAAPELMAFAKDPPENARIDLTDDIVGIIRHLKPEGAIPFFVDIVRANPEDAGDDVYFALQDYGAEAIGPLVDLYHEIDEDVSGDLAFALSAMRPRDPRVFQLLVDRLEYDMEDTALALGLYGDEAARPYLEKYRQEDPENSFLRDAFEELGQNDTLERDAFNIWDAYPDTDTPDVSVLTEADRLELIAQGETAQDRIEAAHSFMSEPQNGKVYSTLLKAAQSDPEPTVRGAAWKTLGAYIHAHETLVDLMWSRVSDENAPLEERGGAIIALSYGADEEERLEPYLEQFYQNTASRRDAMEAMWRSNNPRWADYFLRHLDDADVELQRSAIRGVGFCQVRGESNRLKSFWRDDELREEALYAYALAAPSDASPARMRSLLKKIDDEAGLSEQERELVMLALDERMQMAGKEPVFFPDEEEDEDDED